MGSYIYGGQFAPLGNDIVYKLITFGLGHFMSDESNNLLNCCAFMKWMMTSASSTILVFVAIYADFM